jgi:hypothetical protein
MNEMIKKYLKINESEDKDLKLFWKKESGTSLEKFIKYIKKSEGNSYPYMKFQKVFFDKYFKLFDKKIQDEISLQMYEIKELKKLWDIL